MHVMVTGGAGFIGSHIADALVAAGHRVTILDDLSTGRRENIAGGIELIELDVTTPETFGILSELRPDAVVHCAAQISVSKSVEDPLEDLHRNVTGTVNLLLAARLVGASAFVFASSAAVYGDPRYVPLDEEHPLRPLSPYGLSKLAAEGYVRILCEQYGIRWVILRYANVFGPRQQPKGDGAVVPAFVSGFLEGRDPVIHGDGEQTRDFIFVQDVAQANLLAISSQEQGIFNISSGVATSIRDLWRAAADMTGWQRAPTYGEPRPGDIPHSVLSSEAARGRLGFCARTDLTTGLRQTVASSR